jgi:hypothetical protein
MSRVRENLIRKLVRELIKQELDEANSTASVGGSYNTPHAFGGSNKKGKKKGKAGYKGGHTEPTNGTGHFIADDPKLRKESINEAKNTNVEWNKFEKAFGDFFTTVIRLGKANTKLTGDKTDEKIFIKNFNKDVGKFYSLMQSWVRGQNESVNEGKYHDYRNDTTMTPKQKIGMAMRETRDSLRDLEGIVKNNVRLKTELNVDSRSYWKNTHKALSKISERLVNLANKVGQLH